MGPDTDQQHAIERSALRDRLSGPWLSAFLIVVVLGGGCAVFVIALTYISRAGGLPAAPNTNYATIASADTADADRMLAWIAEGSGLRTDHLAPRLLVVWRSPDDPALVRIVFAVEAGSMESRGSIDNLLINAHPDRHHEGYFLPGVESLVAAIPSSCQTQVLLEADFDHAESVDIDVISADSCAVVVFSVRAITAPPDSARVPIRTLSKAPQTARVGFYEYEYVYYK